MESPYPPLPDIEKIIAETVPPITPPAGGYGVPNNLSSEDLLKFSEEVLGSTERFYLQFLSLEEFTDALLEPRFGDILVSEKTLNEYCSLFLHAADEVNWPLAYSGWHMYLKYLHHHAAKSPQVGTADQFFTPFDVPDWAALVGSLPALRLTLLPEFLLIGGIFCVLIYTAILIHRNVDLEYCDSLCDLLVVITFCMCYLYYNDRNVFGEAGYLGLLKMAVSFITCVHLYQLPLRETRLELDSPVYVVFVCLMCLGVLLACSGDDLFTLYFSLELIGFSSYAFHCFYSPKEIGHPLTKVLLGALSSLFFISGSFMLYWAKGSLDLCNFTHFFCYTQLTLYGESSTDSLLDIGLCFIFFSLYLKVVFAPAQLLEFRSYGFDFGDPVDAYFANVTRLGVAIVLCRISYCVFSYLDLTWLTLLTSIGLLSVFMGALAGSGPSRHETVLAYGSVTNMGYALILLGGFSNPQVWDTLVSVVFYQFIFLGLLTFFIIASIERQRVPTYSGTMSILKTWLIAGALAFFFTLYAVTGIPPLLLTVPKLCLFFKVLKNGMGIAEGIVVVLFAFVALVYYFKFIRIIFLDNALVRWWSYSNFNMYYTMGWSYIHYLIYMYNDTWLATVVMVSAGFLPSVYYWFASHVPLPNVWFVREYHAELAKKITVFQHFFEGRNEQLVKELSYVKKDRSGLRFVAFVESWFMKEVRAAEYVYSVAQEESLGREREYAARYYYEFHRRQILMPYRVDFHAKELVRLMHIRL